MRNGRSVLSDDISALQSQVVQSVRRMECWLAALGLDTSQDQLDYSALWSGLQSDLSDVQLRERLRSGLLECHRTVQCLHLEQGTRGHLKKSVDFLKCFESKKTEACVKKNIKRKLLEKLRRVKYLEP